MKHSDEVIKTLAVMGEIYGKMISPAAARVIALDLSGFEEASILVALKRCRLELTRFPTMAEIIARLDDGRPSPDEAWSMIPRDEDASVVWTEEMSAAYGVARNLLDESEFSARQAFIDKYKSLVADARARNARTRWVPSLGREQTGRAAALIAAVEQRRLSVQEAQQIMPELEQASGRLRLTGPASLPKQITDGHGNSITLANVFPGSR